MEASETRGRHAPLCQRMQGRGGGIIEVDQNFFVVSQSSTLTPLLANALRATHARYLPTSASSNVTATVPTITLKEGSSHNCIGSSENSKR